MAKPSRKPAANDASADPARLRREIQRLTQERDAARDSCEAWERETNKARDTAANAWKERNTAIAERDEAAAAAMAAKDMVERLAEKIDAVEARRDALESQSETLVYQDQVAQADLAAAQETILDLSHRLAAATRELRALKRHYAEKAMAGAAIKPEHGVFAGPAAE